MLPQVYDDTYTFYEDGTFYYFNNQMDCSKREVGYGGDWELTGKTIQLIIRYRDIEKVAGLSHQTEAAEVTRC